MREVGTSQKVRIHRVRWGESVPALAGARFGTWPWPPSPRSTARSTR